MHAEISELPNPNINRAWALLFARLVLGLIFFMAGVMKVFQLGPLEHARKYFLPFSDTFLPTWSLWAVGVTIPFIELIGDALFDFSGHVIPRLALLLFVLSLPREDDRFSLDYFLLRS